jgi:hypothetical protein
MSIPRIKRKIFSSPSERRQKRMRKKWKIYDFYVSYKRDGKHQNVFKDPYTNVSLKRKKSIQKFTFKPKKDSKFEYSGIHTGNYIDHPHSYVGQTGKNF